MSHTHSEDAADHHGLLHVAHVVGQVYADALTSFVVPHHRDHWEEVVEQYDREHPTPGQS
jgi:hypothetical protein